MNNGTKQYFWHYIIGKEFQEAFYILIEKFSAVNGTWTAQIDRPSYYCAGQAIEHYLKSYLDINDVKYPTNSNGHNLVSLIELDKIKINSFFDLENDDISQIQKLNERYFNHDNYGRDDLRYGTITGFRESPHPDNLNRVIDKMGKVLKNKAFMA